MHNRRLFDLIILGLWLFIAITITVDYKIKNKISQSYSLALQPNKEIEIKNISVINNNSFDIVLKDKSRIIVSLPLSLKEESKRKVLDLLSEVSNPRVILYNKKKNGQWTANLKFFLQNKEISLEEWLEKNDLVMP